MSSYAVIELEESPITKGTDTTATGSRISTVKHFLPIQSASLTEGVAHLDRSDEQRGIRATPPKLVDAYAPGGSLSLRATPGLWVPLLALAGWTPTWAAGAGTNKVMRVTPTTVTDGTFTLTVNDGTTSATTAAIAYNATAATVQTALEALDIVEAGEIAVTGGPLSSAFMAFTFKGRFAASNTPTIASDDAALTGTLADTTETTGAPGAVLDPDGNGIPTGAYRVQFTKRAGRTAKSAQVTLVYADDGFYQRGNGMGISSLSMSANGELSADLVGLYVRDLDADPGYTPTYEALAIHPMRRGDIRLDWLTGSAYQQDFDFQVTNPIGRGDHLGLKGYWPKLLEYETGNVQVTGNVSTRYVDPQDLRALAAATTFEALAGWTTDSQIASSGAYYAGWLEIGAGQLTSGAADALTNGQRFGGSFGWEANYSESAGYDARFTVVCGLASAAALESYA